MAVLKQGQQQFGAKFGTQPKTSACCAKAGAFTASPAAAQSKTAVGTVGSSAKPKGPKVIKVQQKKMPRPRKPPGPAPATAPLTGLFQCEKDAFEKGCKPWKLGRCQRGVGCNSAGATANAKGKRQRVDTAAKLLASADRATWFSARASSQVPEEASDTWTDVQWPSDADALDADELTFRVSGTSRRSGGSCFVQRH